MNLKILFSEESKLSEYFYTFLKYPKLGLFYFKRRNRYCNSKEKLVI